MVRAIETLGTAAAAAKVEAALESGEPLQLALRPSTTTPVLTTEALPTSVRDITVEAARAADFDALLRGAA